MWSDVAMCLNNSVSKNDEKGSFKGKFGRGRKSIFSTSVEDVTTALDEEKSIVKTCSARGIVRSLDMSVSTVHKIIFKMPHCYPYKITHI